MEELMNRFDRAAQARANVKPTLADDQKNKFQRHTEVVTAQRANTSAHHAHVSDLAARRSAWVGDGREGGVKTVSGVALDSKTAALKSASDASRKAVPAVAPQRLSQATVEAITSQWVADHPDFYASEFNNTSMKNFAMLNVIENNIPFSIELLNAGFDFLWTHNHLERRPGVPRKRGDVVSAAAPVLFTYDSPEEIEARTEFHNLFAQAEDAAAGERAKSLSFDELQKEVKSGRKVFSQGGY
jgi:hypothetical protein